MDISREEGEQLAQIQADLEARTFRGRNLDVYPGKIIALRPGSFHLYPIEDDAFDPSIERIMGISLWGAFDEWRLGLVRVEPGDKGRCAILISTEEPIPDTGIPVIDTWIARVRTLKVLREDRAFGYGEIPLSPFRYSAAVREITRLVKDSAIALLDRAPQDRRETLLALARVAISDTLDDQTLDETCLELVANRQAWKRHTVIPPEEVPGSITIHPETIESLKCMLESEIRDAKNGLQPVAPPIGSSYPTTRDLTEAAGISNNIFLRVRKAAGIDHGLTGHAASKRQFPPYEVDLLREAVRQGSFFDRERMLRSWAKWGTEGSVDRR